MPPPRAILVLIISAVFCVTSASGFARSTHSGASRPTPRSNTSGNRMATATHLVEPTERDARYGEPLNAARYLVDLHDAKAAFDFCGGMMFQLVLSDKLRDHLIQVAEVDDEEKQPVIFDSSKNRMFRIPDYSQEGRADNIRVFHGREIRQVPDAAGGMGFVLQLSLAEGDDPEGWTKQEVEGYDGWGHDSGRIWRKGEMLENEGFESFRTDFGPKAFALHHRFYLHFDRQNRIWLSAEDGCEGTPARPVFSSLSNLFGFGR